MLQKLIILVSCEIRASLAAKIELSERRLEKPFQWVRLNCFWLRFPSLNLFWLFLPRFGCLIGASWDSIRESETEVDFDPLLLALWCRNERMSSRTARAENEIQSARFSLDCEAHRSV